RPAKLLFASKSSPTGIPRGGIALPPFATSTAGMTHLACRREKSCILLRAIAFASGTEFCAAAAPCPLPLQFFASNLAALQQCIQIGLCCHRIHAGEFQTLPATHARMPKDCLSSLEHALPDTAVQVVGVD